MNMQDRNQLMVSENKNFEVTDRILLTIGKLNYIYLYTYKFSVATNVTFVSKFKVI